MQFSAAGLALVKQWEGCILSAYKDVAGVWTIGYGHTGADVEPGLVWTQAEADAALARELAQFGEGVRQLVGNAPLTDNQFSALTIFAFNIGLGGFRGSLALQRTKEGNLPEVPPAMALWNKIHDPHTGRMVVSRGLVNRRNAEIALWNTP